MDGKLRSRFCRRLYCDGPADLDTVSLPLTEAAVDSFHDAMPAPEGLGRLDLSTACELSEHKGVSPCSMVMSVLYAKRLRHHNSKYLQTMSSSDIFFISMMMASKYLYDEGVEEEVFNDEWADASGQEVEDVNQMERSFLDALDWRLFVKPDEFEDVLAALERRLALKEGLKRGWFTYTELAILLDLRLMCALWNQVGLDCSKMALTVSTSYLASVLCLIGSTAMAVQLSGPLTTATMAVLSMQSSFLFGQSIGNVPSMVVTATKPRLLPKLSAPVTDDVMMNSNESFIMLREVDYEDEGKLNSTNLSSPDSVAGHSKSMFDRLKEDQVIPSLEEDSDVKNPVGKSTRSSVLSLWFFDSLLSQIWSVLEMKPIKQRVNCMNCDNMAVKPTSKNCKGCEDNALDQGRPCKHCFQLRHPKSGRRNYRNLKAEARISSSELSRKGDDPNNLSGARSNEYSFQSHDEQLLMDLPRLDQDKMFKVDSLTCYALRHTGIKDPIHFQHPRTGQMGQEGSSIKQSKAGAYLDSVLKQLWRLSSIFPTHSLWDDTTFTGLPASVLAT